MYSKHLQKYIPPDFSLEKYEKCKNIGLDGWAENLLLRFTTYLQCKQKNVLSDDTLMQLRDKVNQNIEVAIHRDKVLINFFLEVISAEDDIGRNKVLNDMSYLELFSLMEELKTDELEEQFSRIKSSFINTLDRERLGKLNQVVDISLGVEDYSAWLRINMDCSKSEIMGAFEDWLDWKKAELEKTKIHTKHDKKINVFSESAFDSWTQAKVLPYLDLYCWNKLNGVELSEDILNDLLFPLPDDPANGVAHKTKGYVRKLMSLSTFKRMFSVLSSKK
jgi:hypothetical protein